MLNMFKKETPADKVRAEIKSIELKKSSANSVRENQKATEKANGDKCLFNAGMQAYKQFKNETTEIDINDCFAGYEASIIAMQEIDKKTDTMIERYDEEISVLTANLVILEAEATQPAPTQTNTAQTNSSVAIFCENCGTSLNSSDAFCQNCGTKIV